MQISGGNIVVWSVFRPPLDLQTLRQDYSKEQKFCITIYGVATIIVTAILLTLLGFVAVYLRFHMRVHLTSTYVGIDDWLSASGDCRASKTLRRSMASRRLMRR